MYALASFIWRLIVGDPYDKAKHRTGTLVTNLERRRGWRYKRPEHRWMTSTALLRHVRTRDAHTETRPLRWYEQDVQPQSDEDWVAYTRRHNEAYTLYHDTTMDHIRQEVQQIVHWHHGDAMGRAT
jgi:hypothetical protein